VSLGQPPFRGRQLFHWVHGLLESRPERMANLPASFRSRLAERVGPTVAVAERELISGDGLTRKRLLRLGDGRTVEAVLMEARGAGPEAERYTVCVSSQVGCALGCSFCVTGQMGFGRNLSPGEIVEQVYHFERALRSANGAAGRRFVTNVVFMGMGEPLANYAAALRAVRLLISQEGLGLGARRITISTAGLIPGIERLASEGLQLGLAISLHAPSDELREKLMPIDRRYPIAPLLQAADRYSSVTGRRVTYEYAMISGVNDGPAQARQLAGLLSGRLCHVNLIPLNSSLDPRLKPSPRDRIIAFRQTLLDAGVPCTLRETRGRDILAACGQLGYTEGARKKGRVASAEG